MLLLLCAAFQAKAQTEQGQLAGNILDPTGAAIAGATITAKSGENGSTYNTKSTDAGGYRFPSIQLGHYTLTVNAPGFRQVVNTGVEVRVGTTTSIDVTLQAGSAGESVTVEASGNQVETESSDVGGTVTARQIIELPLALGGVGTMRSPDSFVFSIPGTAGPGITSLRVD